MKMNIELSDYELDPISNKDLLVINGGSGPWDFLGPVGAAAGIISAFVGLYEWGYQYAKRKIEANWK